MTDVTIKIEVCGPGISDDEKQIADLCKWVRQELVGTGPNLPEGVDLIRVSSIVNGKEIVYG